jgi:hypothetical protein
MRISEQLFTSALADDERAIAQMLAELTPDIRRYARRAPFADLSTPIVLGIQPDVDNKNSTATTNWVSSPPNPSNLYR